MNPLDLILSLLVLLSSLVNLSSAPEPVRPPVKKPAVTRERTQATQKPRSKATPAKPTQQSIFKTPHYPRGQNQARPTNSSSLGADWEKPARHYSGGGYGIDLLNKRFEESPQNGGYPQDREIVSHVAASRRLPFRLLWATYGNESGWGKISWKGGIIPYFGLTWDYPGQGTSGNFNKDANRAAQIWVELYTKYNGHRPRL